jgi:hypothetical protein
MAMAPVTPVESDGISGQKPSHDRADRRKPRAQQQVGVIGDQSPCETICVRLSQYPPQPVYEGITISIVPENFPAFDSAHNNMVQRPWGINSGFPWHG